MLVESTIIFASVWTSDLGHYLEIHHLKQSLAVLKVFACVKQPVGFACLVNEACKALPALLGILSAGTEEGNESDDTLAMACQTANCLLLKEPETGKRLLNSNLISSLNDLAQNE